MATILTKNGLFIELQVQGADSKSSYFNESISYTYVGSTVHITFQPNTEYPAFDIFHNEVSNLLDESLNPFNQTTLDVFFASFDSGGLTDENIIYVSDITNLPSPVTGVITLPNEGKLYWFTRQVNLNNNILRVGTNILKGFDQNTTGISNSNIECLESSTLRDIQLININVKFDDPNGAYDWRYVNFVDCANAITVNQALFLIFDTFAFINSPRFVIDGQINTLVISPNTIWRGSSESLARMVDFTENAIVTGRVRIEQSRFILTTDQIGVFINPLSTIGKERFILSNVFFENGLPPINIDGSDERAVFTNVDADGIVNSRNFANAYLSPVAQPTTISPTTPTKIAMINVLSANSQKFTTDGLGMLVCNSVVRKSYGINFSASFQAANNRIFEITLYKNGTLIQGTASRGTGEGGIRSDNVVTFTEVELVQGDFIEAYVENLTNADNVTIASLNWLIKE